MDLQTALSNIQAAGGLTIKGSGELQYEGFDIGGPRGGIAQYQGLTYLVDSRDLDGNLAPVLEVYDEDNERVEGWTISVAGGALDFQPL